MTENKTAAKMNAEEIGSALCRYYNVASISELMELPRFKEEFARTKNAGAALMAMNKVVETDLTANGVYIRQGYLSDWDEKAKRKVVTAEGPVVLFPDGQTKLFATKGEQVEPPGPPCATWLQVGGIVKKHYIAEDRTEYVLDDASIKGRLSSPPEDFPKVGVSRYLTGKFYCMLMDDDRKVIKGATSNKSTVFATGTILTEEDDVRVNTDPEYNREPHIKVRVQDHEGNIFSLKIPIQQVCDAFGLDSDSSFEDFREALYGQPIAVNGGLGFTSPANAKDFEPSGTEPSDFHVLTDAVNELDNLGFFIEREVKGRKLRALSLKGKKGKDGKPVTFVRIGGIRVYDLYEEPDKETGEVKWVAQAHHEDLDRDIWFSAIERSGHWKSDKGEGDWIVYPGAYIKFLNNLGGSVTLPSDNPFAKLATSAKTLYEFDGAKTATPNGADKSSTAKPVVKATSAGTGVDFL